MKKMLLQLSLIALLAQMPLQAKQTVSQNLSDIKNKVMAFPGWAWSYKSRAYNRIKRCLVERKECSPAELSQAKKEAAVLGIAGTIIGGWTAKSLYGKYRTAIPKDKSKKLSNASKATLLKNMKNNQRC